MLLFQGVFCLLGSRIKEKPLSGTCCSHSRGGKVAGEIMQCLLNLLFGTGPLSRPLISHWRKQVTGSCTMFPWESTASHRQWGGMANPLTGQRGAGIWEHDAQCWAWRNE